MSHTPQIEAPHTAALRRLAVWLMALIAVITISVLWTVRETALIEPTPVVLQGRS